VPDQPASATRPSPPAAPLPDTAVLAREIPALMAAADIPGLSVAVVQQGRVVWTGAFGTRNDPGRTPVDQETIFEAASLSKPVFAYLVLRLADRRAFDLDRPLAQLVEYPRLAHDPRAGRITARMVLAHATGLPNWGGDTLTLGFDPGTAYGYSGEGFVYLQRAVERVTGQSLDQLARQEVFEPLGMTRSGYRWRPAFGDDAAYGTDWLRRPAPAIRYADANAAASLLTTAGDYARFVTAVLTGRGLSPEGWRAFLTPVRETSPGISIGLGIRVEGPPAARIFYHSGNNGRRFTSYMAGNVATGLGLVYFTNAPNGTSLVAALAPRVFGADHPPRHWATFDRYDDPRLAAQRAVERAAADSGADAARRRLAAMAAAPATRPTFDQTLALGDYLSSRGLAPLAIELLQRTVAATPGSADGRLALGRAWEKAGRLDSALAWYRRAGQVGGAEDEAARQIRWTEARLAARARPVRLGPERLRRFAGPYRDRTVTLHDGRLYYEGGPAPPAPMIPLADDLFELASDPAVRVRFVGGGAGPASRIVVRYSDGTVDEWARSP
jgi:CubicO group peptidase (beta-lactamase class C family)